MVSPLVMIPWLILALPVVSLVRWAGLRRERRSDYARFVEWRQFPVWRVALGKLVFFALLGAGSIVYSVTFDRTAMALIAIGTCGFLIEDSIVSGRPMPTPGYHASGWLCRSCTASDHDHCTNMRMLDSFENAFRGKDGSRRPVCCCGFRLGVWKEEPV